MTNTERQIWELVHNWCNEQSCEIPDFNRRVLMERILALRQPLVSGSVCCGAELIKFNTYGYDECADCGKTYRQQTDR